MRRIGYRARDLQANGTHVLIGRLFGLVPGRSDRHHAADAIGIVSRQRDSISRSFRHIHPSDPAIDLVRRLDGIQYARVIGDDPTRCDHAHEILGRIRGKRLMQVQIDQILTPRNPSGIRQS